MSSTECPGKNLSKKNIAEWKACAGRVSPSVAAQQTATLGHSFHHWRRVPRLVKAALADLNRLQTFLAS